jgi:hypothetical protein
MLVDIEIRETLSYYCMVTKQTQEKAANLALRELLQQAENDPVMKERMDRASSRSSVLDKWHRDVRGGAVVGRKKKKALKVKDPIRYGEMVRHVPDEQPELGCMESWRMGITKPTGPVPQLANIVLDRQNVLRTYGTEGNVKTNFCPKCNGYVFQNHEHKN